MKQCKIVILLALALIPYLFGMKKQEKFSNLRMSNKQYKALTQRLNKSVDIQDSLKSANNFILKQGQKTIPLTSAIVDIDSASFLLPSDILVPKLVKTNNYWIIYNVILSPTDSNIVKYDKQGNFLSKFVRKGRGPNEATKIDAIAEMNHTIYISDDGSLKKFSKKDELIGQKLLNIWAQDIQLNKNDYELRSPANKVFSFPIYTLDIDTDTIKSAIKDNRKDEFNYKSSANTTFYSNDSVILYAKTSSSTIHVFSKKQNKFIKHYKLEADFIRKNVEVLPKEFSKAEFMQFYKSLFLIDKIHLFQDKLYITFRGRNNSKTDYFLTIAEISQENDEFIPLKVYQTDNLFKNAYFSAGHLYYYNPKKDDKTLTVYTIKLKEL